MVRIPESWAFRVLSRVSALLFAFASSRKCFLGRLFAVSLAARTAQGIARRGCDRVRNNDQSVGERDFLERRSARRRQLDCLAFDGRNP